MYAFRGHFLDLRQLHFALTDEKGSLGSMCESWRVEHGKIEAPEHGRITPEYVEYNRRDVKATAELCFKLLEEYNLHPTALQPTKAYSPASIGKAYLEAMGIQPILARQPDFPKEVLGHAMTAYYGGRAEAHIRRVPVPVVRVDFFSMYPTNCIQMKIWRLLTCERIRIVDATDDVRALLSRITPGDCFNPALWEQFVCLVQIVPQKDVLPVRARYDSGPSWNIGVNPLTSTEPMWFSLPDIIASTILTGRPPQVLRALRFVPVGVSPTLRPVSLRSSVPVDPGTQDFFRVVIEEPKRIRTRTDIPEKERARLGRFLKVLANATSYGIFAEMVRHELPGVSREAVRVYGLDAEPITVDVTAPEAPGDFAFPSIAACITGAARLRLALLEYLVTQAGGTYASCDTDAMDIVATPRGGLIPCPGGAERLPDGGEAIRALSWDDVERIRQAFASLNPYDSQTVNSILELKEENYDPQTNQRRQLYCYIISAKRYVLFNLDEDGKPIQRGKPSEHGLGHLLNPTNPKDPDRKWIRTLWAGIVTEDALGQRYAWPDWLARPAIGRITVSSPSLLHLFKGVNRGKSYPDQIKPFNFLLTAFVRAFGHPDGVDPERFHLVAPWIADPRQWLTLAWIDRDSGRRFHITTSGHTGGERVARVKTYGDVLREYRTHPEPKSLGPDGLPCSRKTRGLLSRRPVTVAHISYIGKESNKLDDREAGIVHDVGEVVTEYRDPRRDPFHLLVLHVLRNHPTTDIAKAVGLDPTTTRRILGSRSHPRPEHKSALVALAVRTARDSLRDWGIIAPTDDTACCAVYLEERGRGGVQTCPICRGPLAHRGSHYCGAACKQRAYRLRMKESIRGK